MARTRVPSHVWLQCDRCRSVGLVRRSGPKTSRKCHFCHGMRRNGVGGKQCIPVACPYPEVGRLGALFVEPGFDGVVVEVNRAVDEIGDVVAWNARNDARWASLTPEERTTATTYTKDQWREIRKVCIPLGRMEYSIDPDDPASWGVNDTDE